MSRKLTIGVDVGGTFTDLFLLDEATGAFSVGKVPSTRGNEALGVLAGIASTGAGAGEIATIVHGTTVATNALLERRCAPAGLITTAGFRDVLEMRRRDRPTTWGLRGTFEPMIPRHMRREVAERTLADGEILEAVDLAAVEREARDLIAAGARAVALVFLNAHANPANERAAAAVLRRIWPNEHVSVSSEILPEIREFERTSTTALNATLQPVVADYIDRLETELKGRGFGGELLIVQSNGGVMSAERARARPVRTALSGPAAGVMAAARIAEAAGFRNVVTGDVGGTSFDVSIIAEGEIARAAQTSIGFGQVIRTPMIEISTIGAGGGSIASVDAGGILIVGPESAGAVPGPACYGRGNDRPTVTDANLLLGRIDPERPIGALAAFDVAAARAAVERHVARPLGLDVLSAAEAIVRLANSKMASAIRLVSIERGHDPRKFVLMPFGGGGALHAGALLKELSLMAALVPLYPGVTSALGCVLADMRYDYVETLNVTLDALEPARFAEEAGRLVAAGETLLARSGIAFAGRGQEIALDMLYVGQTHAVTVPIDWRPGLPPPDRAALRAAFEAHYQQSRGAPLGDMPLRVLNLHVAVVGKRPPFDLAALAPKAKAGAVEPKRRRQVRVDGAMHEARVYDRLSLPIGALIEGPAFLEQPDTTIFVEPWLRARVDALGNVVLERRDLG